MYAIINIEWNRKENFESNRSHRRKEFSIQRPDLREQTRIRDDNLTCWEPSILDQQQDHDSVANRPGDGARGERKGTDGQLPSVNGLNVGIANVRQVWFRLTPVYPDVAEPLKERTELTALNLPSICDDLIAILTPWFSRDETPPPQLI
ncbi:hypothetical protein T10_3947 [Trichinella papuae]|uniref:Uncharacterized protein n=1 Tax=Trichinella papuae TaxID=268474 RepID=A0A0V1MFI1_9BILA|nr:hypothetical protein T10_3947 [Trichinella papuae]